MDQTEIILLSKQNAAQSIRSRQNDSGNKTEETTNDFRDMLTRKQGELPADTVQNDSGASGDNDLPSASGEEISNEQRELAAALAAQTAAVVQPVIISLEQTDETAPQAATGIPETAGMVQTVMAQQADIQPVLYENTGLEPELETGINQTDEYVQVIPTQAASISEQSTGTDGAADADAGGVIAASDTDVKVLVQSAQTETDTSGDTSAGSSEDMSASRDAETDKNSVSIFQENTPLFRNVESAPVKVGDAEEVNVQSSDAENQLADKVGNALDNGLSHVKIQLTPESLGTVTVEMTRTEDGMLHVVLNAAEHSASAILEQHTSGLQALLADRTQETVDVQVYQQRENQQADNNSFDRDGQNRQQYQQDSRRRNQQNDDFIQQIRLGLIDADEEAV